MSNAKEIFIKLTQENITNKAILYCIEFKKAKLVNTELMRKLIIDNQEYREVLGTKFYQDYLKRCIDICINFRKAFHQTKYSKNVKIQLWKLFDNTPILSCDVDNFTKVINELSTYKIFNYMCMPYGNDTTMIFYCIDTYNDAELKYKRALYDIINTYDYLNPYDKFGNNTHQTQFDLLATIDERKVKDSLRWIKKGYDCSDEYQYMNIEKIPAFKYLEGVIDGKD